MESTAVIVSTICGKFPNSYHTKLCHNKTDTNTSNAKVQNMTMKG